MCIVLSHFSCVWLFEMLWTIARQVYLGFSRQEYWSGLPFSPSGDLRDLGSNLCLLWHLQAGSLPLMPPHHTAIFSDLCELPFWHNYKVWSYVIVERIRKIHMWLLWEEIPGRLCLVSPGFLLFLCLFRLLILICNLSLL